MTARVAADYADTTIWTIRRSVTPCGRRGRSFIYAIEDVERWMRGTPIEATAAPAPHVRGARAIGGEVTSREAALARIRGLARGDRR